MSRTIPALNGKYVVSLGPRCHVMCTDRLNGDFYWGLDLEKQYGTEIPLWYTGQCPLLDDSIAVIAPGGTVLMTGIDCASGQSVWETPNPDQWKMSHSSIIPASFLGKKMYIYAAIGGICGVSAEGEDRGKLLWKLGDWSPSVIAPAPLPLNDNSLFVTGGYGAGGAIIRISRKGDNFSAALQAAWLPHEGLASEQQTPLLYRGYVYGILPKDAGANRNQLMRYQQGNLQEADWQSGKTLRFGLGPYMILNDHLLVLNDEGTLFLFRLSGKEPEELHHVKLFEGQDACGPLAFADNCCCCVIPKYLLHRLKTMDYENRIWIYLLVLLLTFVDHLFNRLVKPDLNPAQNPYDLSLDSLAQIGLNCIYPDYSYIDLPLPQAKALATDSAGTYW